MQTERPADEADSQISDLGMAPAGTWVALWRRWWWVLIPVGILLQAVARR